MTAGEKIKYYRRLKDYSQKKLSEYSGVSEISIRKYEAGERNPKPEQLQKIADALDLPIIRFLDLDLSPMQLETLGDFAACFLMLEKQLGAQLVYETDADQIVIEDSVSIKFSNKMAQSCLVTLAHQYNLANCLLDLAKEEDKTPDLERVQAQTGVNELTIDGIKRKLLDAKDPLFTEE